MFTPLDFALINALQFNPRISWADLGRILAIDPSTLSRRWSRLTQEGLVWSSLFRLVDTDMSERAMTFVDVECEPGRRESVIKLLSAEAPVSSIHCTSGSRDLVLTISLTGFLTMDRYIDEVIAIVPGIRRTETHYIRTIFQEGSDWRFRTLSPAQIQAVTETLPAVAGSTAASDFLVDVIAAIGDDVRRPLTEIQRSVGRALPTVSRAVDTLLGANWARWRVDLAHDLAGWTEAMIWMDVPQTEIDRVAAALQFVPQMRLIAATTGASNLTATVWLRDINELSEIEQKLQLVFPGIHIADRCLVPRIPKRMGHVIGYDGRVDHYVSFISGPAVTI